MSLTDAILHGTLDELRQQLDAGADVNEIDVYGYTPLIEAVIKQHTQAVTLLLSRGAEVDKTDVTGCTALYWAVDNSDVALTRQLLAAGADPNLYSSSSQPILASALLKEHPSLIKCLLDHGANQHFAQDYIHAKLLGHRFELRGWVDIVTPDNIFVEMAFEGFYLEFTLNVIRQSLEQFLNSFSASRLKKHFEVIQAVTLALKIAAKLRKYKHYTIDQDAHIEDITALLATQDLQILPVSFEGHAITFVRYKNLWASCDRGVGSKVEETVVISKIGHPEVFTPEFLNYLLYKKKSRAFIKQQLPELLKLKTITTIPTRSQIAGNCSWANVEASLPTALFMMQYAGRRRHQAEKDKREAMQVYHTWLEWDKGFALNECLSDFKQASASRKASKAAMAAAVLFQALDPAISNDVARGRKILEVLEDPDYAYILRSYESVYQASQGTGPGRRFSELLALCRSSS